MRALLVSDDIRVTQTMSGQPPSYYPPPGAGSVGIGRRPASSGPAAAAAAAPASLGAPTSAGNRPASSQSHHHRQHHHHRGEAESPAAGANHYGGSLDRRRRVISGGSSSHQSRPPRKSPGPSIYRTMPLSPPAGTPQPQLPLPGSGRSVTPGRSITPGGGRRTPQQQPHLIRPIPQHLSPGVKPFSPITVPKINQSPVSRRRNYAYNTHLL